MSGQRGTASRRPHYGHGEGMSEVRQHQSCFANREELLRPGLRHDFAIAAAF